MKKLLLLLASGSIALNVGAQQRTMIFNQTENSKIVHRNQLPTKMKATTANKTTAGGYRNYDYNDAMDKVLTVTLTQQIDFTRLFMWNDTSMQVNYTSGASHINMPSIGAILDPSTDANFNNYDYYPGEMKVGPTDAYRVDSLTIFGFYEATPATTSVVDTIRLSFVKGTTSDDMVAGALGGGGHYGAATFLTMRHDSITNAARSGVTAVGSLSTQVMDILLTSADYADTNVNGVWSRTVPVSIGTTASPINVPANGFVGVSITFINGETGIAPNTIVYDATTTTANHNMFTPLIGFASDGVDPQWAPYTPGPSAAADSNVGLFKKYPGTLGWAGLYIPTWAWSTGSGANASALQFPALVWGINCTTCGTVDPVVTPPISVGSVDAIKAVNAFPNPAENQLNISFNLLTATDVNVTLSNMIGQVVATKNMGTIASGKAVFNTTSLPDGVYTYSVVAAGQRTTGRVVVAH